MARNYYAEAIDILEQYKEIPREAVVSIAKRHPKLFVDTVNAGLTSWQVQCKRELGSGENRNFIGAIKLCRNLTGMGLKEAKEAVESL